MSDRIFFSENRALAEMLRTTAEQISELLPFVIGEKPREESQVDESWDDSDWERHMLTPSETSDDGAPVEGNHDDEPTTQEKGVSLESDQDEPEYFSDAAALDRYCFNEDGIDCNGRNGAGDKVTSLEALECDDLGPNAYRFDANGFGKDGFDKFGDGPKDLDCPQDFGGQTLTNSGTEDSIEQDYRQFDPYARAKLEYEQYDLDDRFADCDMQEPEGMDDEQDEEEITRQAFYEGVDNREEESGYDDLKFTMEFWNWTANSNDCYVLDDSEAGEAEEGKVDRLLNALIVGSVAHESEDYAQGFEGTQAEELTVSADAAPVGMEDSYKTIVVHDSHGEIHTLPLTHFSSPMSEELTSHSLYDYASYFMIDGDQWTNAPQLTIEAAMLLKDKQGNVLVTPKFKIPRTWEDDSEAWEKFHGWATGAGVPEYVYDFEVHIGKNLDLNEIADRWVYDEEVVSDEEGLHGN